MEIRKRAAMAEEWKDLIVEILLRLPAESVARFKFVCKNWYHLIRSPYFINMYGNRNFNPKKKVSLYCRSCNPLPCGTRTKVSFRFYHKIVDLTLPIVEHFVQIVGCSNGIVCLSLSYNQDEFLLWNPATKELKHISKLLNLVSKRPATMSTSGFWFNTTTTTTTTTTTFKVVRVEFCNSNAQQGNMAAQVRIFSSIDNSWRLKEFVLPHVPICKCIELQTQMQVTCVKTCMYWLTGRFEGVVDGVLLDHTCIVCFDMVEEVFKPVELPCFPIDFARLPSYKESLAMFVFREVEHTFYYDMWLMNDCDSRNQSWTKQQTFRDVHLPIGFYGDDENNWKLLHKLLRYTGREHPHKLYDEETGKSEAFFASECPFPLLAYYETLAPIH